MKSRQDFDIPLLSTFLDYNPSDGNLYWKLSAGKAKKGNVAGFVGKSYIKVTLCGRTYVAHRLAWALHYKSEPPEIIDHIDGDGFNNKIQNLRDGTGGKNQQNQKAAHSRNKSSSKLGVSLYKGKWRAKIYHKGKYIFLGYHKSEDDAAEAYLKAKREIHDGCLI